MSNFTLDYKSIEMMYDYPVLISEFEDQTEQRRLKTAKKLLGFRLQTSVLTAAQYATYHLFFLGESGPYSSFTFTSPFDSIPYNVRFKEDSFRARYNGGVYSCSFEFVVIDQVEI